MSSHTSSSAPRQNGNPLVKWILFILFFIIFFFAASSSINSCKDEKKVKKEQEAKKAKMDGSFVRVMNDTYIEYGNLSSFTYILPLNCEFQILDATEPYCVTNRYGEKFCGDKGEDISPQMGYSKKNTELKFKSKNGKIGRLKINLIK